MRGGEGQGDGEERVVPHLYVKETEKADTQYFMPSQPVLVRPLDLPGVPGCLV